MVKRLISVGGINIPDGLKDKIICRFEKVTMDFIESSLDLDTFAKISNNMKLGSVIKEIINAETYFLIGKFQGSSQGYDINRYPLRKCGKQEVDLKDLYNYFSIDSSDFQSLEFDKDSPADKDSVEKIYRHAFQVLLEKFSNSINELQNTKE
ncbi:MAG: hypothetical protein KAI71_00150 [Candidatus Pacebacteria bacterium]|nr:hypothetical protein [Candidatus Paceibacterota bacterium]